MTDYCLFTIEHPKAKRIFIRGVADITEPIDDYNKIIQFREGSKLTATLPKNPYSMGEQEHKLFEELLSSIKTHFEEIGDELVFADQYDSKHSAINNRSSTDEYIIEMEKVIL